MTPDELEAARVQAEVLSFLRDLKEARAVEKAAGVTLVTLYEGQRGLANTVTEHIHDDAEKHRLLDRRVTRTEDDLESMANRSEITDRHNIEALATAAEAKGLAMGRAVRHSSPMPEKRRFYDRALEHVATKVAGAVLLVSMGWVLRHCGLGEPNAGANAHIVVDAGK